jgi:glycosyltransferase involved in cell wall biosynthesis
MRIGIDNISPGESTGNAALGGMRHFMQSLVRELPVIGAAHQFELFSPAWSDPFPCPAAANLSCVPGLPVPHPRMARAVYEQFLLPGRIAARNISAWLGTCNVLPLRLRCPAVLMVQSVQFITQPETYRAPRRLYLSAMLRLSVRRADAIVVFSQANKKQLVEWFGLDARRVQVIPHAFRFSPEELTPHPERQESIFALTSGPYLLCVSAFYPYKNLLRLIEAYSSLPAARTHKLVLAGAPTEFQSQDEIRAAAQKHGVAGNVICLGRVPDAQLPDLYKFAAAMVMPSMEETFGLPVLEAMAFGCPVVTSNVSSMPEIVGDAGVLVDPRSVSSIASGIELILTDSARRESMRAAGVLRAREFTYSRFFRQLLAVLESVGEGPDRA